MFRSESMEYCQLIVPRESGYDALNSLGQLDCIQLIESEDNKTFQKGFNNQIKRCDELLDKINYLMFEISKQEQVEDIKDFELILEYFEKVMKHKSQHQYLDQLEDYINKKHQFMKDQYETLNRLKDKMEQIEDEKQGIVLSRQWLGNKYFVSNQQEQGQDNNINNVMMLPQQRFKNIIGIINIQDFLQFSRTIFRITKNNFTMNNHQINNTKICFLLIYPSQLQQSEINSKINRVCDNYSIQRIQLPQNESQWDQQYNNYDKQLGEIENLMNLTQKLIKQQIPTLLHNDQSFPSIQYIRLYIVREKYLYSNLNIMNMQSSLFTCKFWLKSNYKNQIQSQLQYGQIQFQSNDQHNPPTYFKTNQFNQLFQQIVYTYGIPRYKEINPTIFTIVTFPFLFAVMFGDFFHGIAILIFGLYLSYTKSFSPRAILKQQRQQRIKQGIQQSSQQEVQSESSLQIVYDLRYIFIMCGAFSLYVGMIYNEYAGFQIDIFSNKFGLQPQFTHSMNFSNSFKMKLSIILGYVQMILGILVYAFNQSYHRNYTNLLLVFPAKIIFFSSTIGYLVFLIIYKWNVKWQSDLAPSIITTFVNMFLHAGDFGDLQMFNNQQLIQVLLLVFTLLSIPMMLLPPIIKDLKTFSQGEFQSIHHDFNSAGDIIVHHVIETIEFILGTISNTASYLRLWALSLAHSQLAAVFYSLTLSGHVQQGQWLGLVIMFPIYAFVITGVLLIMDAMECFLHALRLHWQQIVFDLYLDRVEFQNKFFYGDGHLFVSFSFTRMIKEYQEKNRFI